MAQGWSMPDGPSWDHPGQESCHIRVWDLEDKSTDFEFLSDLDDEDDLGLGILYAVDPLINQAFTHFVKWMAPNEGYIMERWDMNETNEVLSFKILK